jgi:hypothetical protein
MLFMANQNLSSFDDSQPVVFHLPDGVANLITWSYVLKQLNEQLQPVIDILSAENADLKRINDRVDEWLENQEHGDD